MTKDKNFSGINKIVANGKSLDLSTPKVMGILNLTDDSFYDGGKHNSIKSALKQSEKMIAEGAHIIDVGAYSSRPGAKHINTNDEWKRLENILKNIINEFNNVMISVDTFRAEIAKRSNDIGADIINDISSGKLDDKMFETMGKIKLPYVMMHMQGNPQNMQQNPSYSDVTSEVFQFFKKNIKKAREHNIQQFIIDPGLGFGKNIHHNYELIKNLTEFKKLNFPVLIGCSRKSMIYKLLECTSEESLNGTTTLNTLCLTKGASILRVHDVKQAMECIKIVNFASK